MRTDQPEVAAEAIVWAAHHYRREWNVGTPTSIVLWGNKFFPGFGDWYLAKTGYDSHMTDEAEDPNRPHNLWEPLPGDHGTHGRFDRRAHNFSPQFWLTKRAGLFAAGTAAALIGWFVRQGVASPSKRPARSPATSRPRTARRLASAT